jgi:hypothetical protein
MVKRAFHAKKSLVEGYKRRSKTAEALIRGLRKGEL